MLLYNLLKFVYMKISYFKINYYVWKVHLNNSSKNLLNRLHQISKEDVALRASRVLLNVFMFISQLNFRSFSRLWNALRAELNRHFLWCS